MEQLLLIIQANNHKYKFLISEHLRIECQDAITWEKHGAIQWAESMTSMRALGWAALKLLMRIQEAAMDKEPHDQNQRLKHCYKLKNLGTTEN